MSKRFNALSDALRRRARLSFAKKWKIEQNSYYPHHRLSVCVRVQFHRSSALPVFDVYLRCQSNYSQFLTVKNAAAFWSIELSFLFNASPLCIFQNNNRVCEADGQTVSGRLEILDLQTEVENYSHLQMFNNFLCRVQLSWLDNLYAKKYSQVQNRKFNLLFAATHETPYLSWKRQCFSQTNFWCNPKAARPLDPLGGVSWWNRKKSERPEGNTLPLIAIKSSIHSTPLNSQLQKETSSLCTFPAILDIVSPAVEDDASQHFHQKPQFATGTICVFPPCSIFIIYWNRVWLIPTSYPPP